jgi:hypothetical protein
MRGCFIFVVRGDIAEGIQLQHFVMEELSAKRH